MRKPAANRVRKRAPPTTLLPWPLPVEFDEPDVEFAEPLELAMRSTAEPASFDSLAEALAAIRAP